MSIDSLQVGGWERGFLVRVIGHGTLRNSPAFREFVLQCLQHRGAQVVVDLSECDYLDSTFLGCLIGVQKHCEGDASRFVIAADKATRVRLFSISVIEHILPLTDSCPPPVGELLTLETSDLSPRALGRHVMQAHRQLATLECEEARSFQSIVERLARELGE